MRSITITCSDSTARSIIELLLDDKAVFSITSQEVGVKDPKPDNGPKRQHRQKLSLGNRSLVCILKLGSAQEKFESRDLEAMIERIGLNPKSAPPAISHAIRAGVLLRDGKSCWLSEKGRELVKKVPSE